MKITRSGLTAIGCAVALLWTILLAERAIVWRADAERAAAMRIIERLRENRQPPAPASIPSARPRSQRPVLA